MADEELRNRVAGEIISGVVAVAVAYCSAKLYGLLRDEDDPVLELWNRAKAAIGEGVQTYQATQASLSEIAKVHTRTRDILREAWKRYEAGQDPTEEGEG